MGKGYHTNTTGLTEFVDQAARSTHLGEHDDD
jgi:hypothetical protein